MASRGIYVFASAQGLLDVEEMSAELIARKAMNFAAELYVIQIMSTWSWSWIRSKQTSRQTENPELAD